MKFFKYSVIAIDSLRILQNLFQMYKGLEFVTIHFEIKMKNCCFSEIERHLRTVKFRKLGQCFIGRYSYFCFWVRIMKCRVRIVIVSVVVGFILEYNH